MENLLLTLLTTIAIIGAIVICALTLALLFGLFYVLYEILGIGDKIYYLKKWIEELKDKRRNK